MTANYIFWPFATGICFFAFCGVVLYLVMTASIHDER